MVFSRLLSSGIDLIKAIGRIMTKRLYELALKSRFFEIPIRSPPGTSLGHSPRRAISTMKS